MTAYRTRKEAREVSRQIEDATVRKVAGEWVVIPSRYVAVVEESEGQDAWDQFDSVDDMEADLEEQKAAWEADEQDEIDRTTEEVDLDDDREPVEIPNTLEANRGESTVEKPVAVVHRLADEMPGARRKDVIQAAVDAGVAFYTARTQYQVWFSKQKQKRAAENA